MIDKLESSLGWWKAMKGGKLGYIPKVISAGLAKTLSFLSTEPVVFWVLLVVFYRFFEHDFRIIVNLSMFPVENYSVRHS